MGVAFEHNVSILVIFCPLVEMPACAHLKAFAAEMQCHKSTTFP